MQPNTEDDQSKNEIEEMKMNSALKAKQHTHTQV